MSYWMAVRRRLMAIALAGIDVAALAIAYTGAMTDQIVTMGDGKQYRLLTLTSSGTLAIPKNVVADICAVGGGAGGYAGSGVVSGGGGSGAYLLNRTGVSFKTAVATIGAGAGAGANGGISRIVLDTGDIKETAKGGNAPSTTHPKGSNGGSGGTGGGAGTYGVGGGDEMVTGSRGFGDGLSKYPFGDTTCFDPHCAGGAGGGCCSINDWGDIREGGGIGGSNGGNGSVPGSPYVSMYERASGGNRGGGQGGSVSRSTCSATSATFYGSGGGGGGAYEDEPDNYGNIDAWAGTGGAGYQGVIYVRIPLDQKAA